MSGLALAATLLAAAPADAQGGAAGRGGPSPDGMVAEALGRLRRADAREQRTRFIVDSLVAAARREATRAPIRAGRLSIEVVGERLPDDMRATLTAAAEAAWNDVAALHDTLAERAALSTPIQLNVGDQREYFSSIRRYQLNIPHTARWHTFTAADARQVMERGTRDLLGSAIGAAMPYPVRDWLGDSWVGLGEPGDATRNNVRTDMAASRSYIGRTCYTEGGPTCAATVQFGTRSADPLHAWYSPRDIEALVAEWVPSDPELKALRARCVADGGAAVCDSAASMINLPVPIPNTVRAHLLQTALRLGGPNAFTRLVAAGSTPERALTAAAGVPADSLLKAWRADFMRAPLRGPRIDVADALTVIVWSGLFGFLATRRRP